MEHLVWIRQNYIFISGTIIFGCIGYFGIPVLVPYTAHDWAWTVMYNHRLNSILMFSVLGFLVACTIAACLKRQHRAWAYGCFSIVLLISIIGSYRILAGNNDTMWTQVRGGIVRVDVVAAALQKGQDDQTQGASLMTAAADIGDASRYFDLQGQNNNMDEVASALYQAGYYLLSTNDPEKFDESKQFIERSLPVIQHADTTTRGMLTPTLINQIMAKMRALTPKDFDHFWFPY